MGGELKPDETILQLLTVIQDKDNSSKALSNKTEGYYTCTRFFY